jgi:hypothetical protein
VPQIIRAKGAYGNDELEGLLKLEQQLNQELEELEKEYVRP